MKILIINGPNLNLLGVREPEIYGSKTFLAYFMDLQSKYSDIDLTYFQSNHEGAIIDKLQEIGFDEVDGIILNAGAYTHTSVAIADCIKAINTPVIEVHISNIHQREEFRKHSWISSVNSGLITGFGLKGYEMAITSFLTD